jgi:hypothetical protein
MIRRRLSLRAVLLTAGIISGLSFTTALGQFPFCSPVQNLGCNAVGCTPAPGSCNPNNPNAPRFGSIMRTPVAYTPCIPGPATTCPNPLNMPVWCSETGWTATLINPCGNLICGLNLPTPGC